MRPSRDELTFCTGYWPVPGNRKRDRSHYRTLLPETLRMLGERRVVFFHADELDLAALRALAPRAQLQPVRIAIEELPSFEIAGRYLRACRAREGGREAIAARALAGLPLGRRLLAWPAWLRRSPGLPYRLKEKGLIHLEREILAAGDRVYLALFSIWTSKILLVQDWIRQARSASAYYAWIDASIPRFNRQRRNWAFMEQDYAPGRIYHYRNHMRYQGRRCPINASLLLGSREAFLALAAGFREVLEGQQDSGYAHDEETLLHLVHGSRSGLFTPIESLRRGA